MRLVLIGIVTAFAYVAPALAGDRRAVDDATLKAALADLKPGDRVVIAAGTYRGSIHLQNVSGTKDAPIVIEAEDPKSPPVFVGGGVAMQLSDCNFVALRNLACRGQTGNGFNIDDGGTFDTPSVGIVLDGLRVSDIGPDGNFDGIKLSGLDRFVVKNCTVEGWGGQAVDLVGCHDGVIEDCAFRGKPGFSQHTGPQFKGGTSDVTIRRCRFENAGARALNVGGSTGLQFFRPAGAKYEAKDITVEDCTIVGSDAPVAFVGVDGATFRHNTVYRPTKWVLRILQETREPGFPPCRNVKFERNLIVYRTADVKVHANIGDATAPDTFTFADNWWFCEDTPAKSKPALPVGEARGVYGIDPKLKDLAPSLPRARDYGARKAD
jgi:hypothetical protein